MNDYYVMFKKETAKANRNKGSKGNANKKGNSIVIEIRSNLKEYGQRKRKGYSKNMGMSASQVRFLSLQNRKHSITNQLSTLSNRKLALSRDMNAVSRRYTNALNQINLKWSNDCGVNTTALSYDLMMKPNDINTEMPYMISDHHGRVVVDDEKIWFDKENCRLLKGNEVPEGVGISYREVAQLISTYSGMVGDNISYTVDENGNIILGTDSPSFSNINNLYNDSNTGFPSGGKGIKDAWRIMNGIEDFDFNNNLRYLVFEKMGLIDDADKAHFNEILTELYGTQAAKDMGFNAMLKSFDKDHDFKLDGEGYSTFFGSIDFSDPEHFEFTKINGKLTGCAMGNLVLAKAYQEEYQAYLNTPFVHPIAGDSTTVDNFVTSTHNISGEWEELDSTDTQVASMYAYNAFKGVGISNRMIGFISQNSEAAESMGININGNTGSLTIDSILKMLGSYNHDIMGDRSYYSDYDRGFSSSKDDVHFGGVDSVTNWSDLYSTSTDSDVTLRTTGKMDHHSYKDHRFDIAYANSGFEQMLNALSDAFMTIPNIDENGVAYAARMTKQLYIDNHSVIENKDGSKKGARTQNRAANVAKGEFGFGWCNKFGSDYDGIAFDVSAMINAFITFYAMYAAVNGDTDRIVASSKPMLKSHIQQAQGYYDKSIANKVKNGNSNPFRNVLTEWQNDGGTVTNNAPTSATPNATVTYTKIVPAEEGVSESYTEQAIVKGDWDGTDFTSVTSISFSTDYGDGVQRKCEEIIKQADGSYKDIFYEAQYNDDGDFNGHVNQSATVIYNADGTASITSASGAFAYTDNDGNVDESSKIYGIQIDEDGNMKYKDASGNYKTKNELSDAFYTEGTSYYISKEGSSVPDPSYDDLFISSEGTSDCKFAKEIILRPKDEFGKAFDNLVAECQARVDQLLDELTNAFSGMEGKFMQYFDALFERIAENGWTYDAKVQKSNNANAANYLDAMLQNNMYMVTEARELNSAGKYQYTTVIAQNVKKIYQVHDDNAENLAFSQYEADKTAIQSKEKIIDARMQRLETEQEAINTEMDSIKKVRNENIEKTFKIFA